MNRFKFKFGRNFGNKTDSIQDFIRIRHNKNALYCFHFVLYFEKDFYKEFILTFFTISLPKK